jgi:hypothetical protein
MNFVDATFRSFDHGIVILRNVSAGHAGAARDVAAWCLPAGKTGKTGKKTKAFEFFREEMLTSTHESMDITDFRL